MNLKTISKRLYHSAIILLETLISLLSVIIFSKYSVKHKLIKLRYNNKVHKSIILANGPSLREYLPAFKREEGVDLWIVNNFPLSSYFFRIKPHYWVLTDPIYFSSDFYGIDSNAIEIVKIMNNVDWPIKVFIPQYVKSNIPLIRDINNKYVSFINYNLTPVSGFHSFENYCFKNFWGLPLPQNVLNTAIYLCISLGYSYVELYGAEHSWIKTLYINNFNQVCMDDKHCYDEKKTERVDDFGAIDKWLFCFARAFKTHRRLRIYADLQGCKIINRTSESFIDAYERTDY